MTPNEILNMRRYIRRNLCPFIIELIFIVSCFTVPYDYHIYTNFLFYLAFAVTTLLESAFPGLDNGMIGLRSNTWFKLLIFAMSTIILPPVVEELFYRKSLIALGNKKIVILTAFIGMFLFALEHALSIWGILLVMVWAVPLSISYIKTKNVYIPMTAHFIVNLAGNGTSVILMAIALMK